MRWFVEISALGLKPGVTSTLCVEAPQWQPALQKARALRGDEGSLGNFSIELLEDGFRAIDPVSRLRYLVKRAPDDAVVTTTAPPVEASPPSSVAPPPSSVAPAASADPAIPPPPRARSLAQTMAFSSQGSAIMSEAVKLADAMAKSAAAAPAPVPVASVAPVLVAPEPESGPVRRQPAKTMVFSSTGSAAVIEAAAAIENARVRPPIPANPVPPPPPAPAPATPALPGYTMVNSREENPSERSPLSYREHVYAVALGTSYEDAHQLVLERFASVQASLEHARQGKLINLAIFDHVFQGRPQRRPLVTLTWKDWKSDAPEVQFPARDGAPSMPPSGLASAGPTLPSTVSESAPPSAHAAPVAIVAAPVPIGSFPAPVRASTPAPAPEISAPASSASPVVTKASGAPPTPERSSAPAPARSSAPPAPASTKIPPAPRPANIAPPVPVRSVPTKRLAGDDLLAELFEAFNDLHFLRDSIEGAEFVLALTLEKLPSELGVISLFDINKREFVVVRQTGGAQRAVGLRQPEKAPIASTAMRQRHAVVVSDPGGAQRAVDDRFKHIGVEIRSLVCAPVELGGATSA